MKQIKLPWGRRRARYLIISRKGKSKHSKLPQSPPLVTFPLKSFRCYNHKGPDLFQPLDERWHSFAQFILDTQHSSLKAPESGTGEGK